MGGSGRPPNPPRGRPGEAVAPASGAGMAGSGRPPSAGEAAAPEVLAVVKDLFFVARIRETGRLTGVPVAVVRTAEDVEAALGGRPRLVLLDLTADLDHDRILAAAGAAAVPVLGYTTHALAGHTQRWHGRCHRVVTKETLTAQLPSLLRQGVAS